MMFPAAVVAVFLAGHMRCFYMLVRKAQGQPSMISTAIWVLAELVLPHLVLHSLDRATQPATGKAGATTRATAIATASASKEAALSDTGSTHAEPLKEGPSSPALDKAGQPCASQHVSPLAVIPPVAGAIDHRARAAANEGLEDPAVHRVLNSQVPEVSSTNGKGSTVHCHWFGRTQRSEIRVIITLPSEWYLGETDLYRVYVIPQ